jgi:hypothetical protein
MVEAVEPFKLHPTSMSSIYKVFEPLLSVVDGHMAAHSHCYYHRYCFPRYGRVLDEILGDVVRVQTMPLRYG